MTGTDRTRRVFVVGSGKWQIPLCKKVKDMGFWLCCSGPDERSPAFEFAEKTLLSDIREKDPNVAFAKECAIDAVLSDQSDVAVPTVASVAEELGLPTIGRKRALLFTQKPKMREFCRENGFPFPDFQECETLDEGRKAAARIGFPLIVKPVDSQASRGVFKIESPKEFDEKFPISQAQGVYNKRVIVEKFLDGTEFTVDGVFVNGVHHTLAISEKKHFEQYPSVASGLYFSHDNDAYDYDGLRDVNDRLMTASGAPFGLTHNEYIFTDGEFYLVEMAARGGGTKISSHIVPAVSGIDNYAILINQALGVPVQSIDEYRFETPYAHAVLEFFDGSQFTCEKADNTISRIEGIETIRSYPGVIDVGLNVQIGDELGDPSDDSKRIGYFIAAASSKQGLLELIKRVNDTIEIA